MDGDRRLSPDYLRHLQAPPSLRSRFPCSLDFRSTLLRRYLRHWPRRGDKQLSGRDRRAPARARREAQRDPSGRNTMGEVQAAPALQYRTARLVLCSWRPCRASRPVDHALDEDVWVHEYRRCLHHALVGTHDPPSHSQRKFSDPSTKETFPLDCKSFGKRSSHGSVHARRDDVLLAVRLHTILTACVAGLRKFSHGSDDHVCLRLGDASVSCGSQCCFFHCQRSVLSYLPPLFLRSRPDSCALQFAERLRAHV